MRHRDFAGLVTALLCVRHLILHLDAASPGFDHLLGQEVSRLLVAEASVDIGDNGDNVRLELVDLGDDFGLLGDICLLTSLVQSSEQFGEFPGIRLPQEG